MQELWYRPIVLLIVLAGIYFTVRTSRVFSQNLHNDTDVSFLFNRCGKPLRRAYAVRSDPEIAVHLGEVLWQKGDKAEAQKLWREAQGKDPKNEALKSTLARLNVSL